MRHKLPPRMVFPVDKLSCYAQWRCPGTCAPGLHDQSSGPSEHMLQLIWLHQRLQRRQLETVRHGKVVILHPGFWNHEAGPDFRRAIIQLADAAPITGDVEVDLSPNGWLSHGHHRNPDFRNVILHVIWEGQPNEDLPTLVVRHVLDSPLEDLAVWTNTEASQEVPPHLQGRCAAILRRFDASALQALLRQAALVRLEGKARCIQSRARQAGWAQALWESLFRGLGYKHNVWPMQRLAELKDQIGVPGHSVAACQATLLGTAGLLPEQVHRHPPHARRYIRQLWDFWWREQASLRPFLLPTQLWRFHGLRPANHPARRLALAAHWLQQKDLVGQIEQWGISSCPRPVSRKIQSLLDILQPREDSFWSWHWTFGSRRHSKPKPLVGRMRLTDLAMNAILPWLWIRAVDGKNWGLQKKLQELYLAWPCGEDNSLLKLARQRLLGTRLPSILTGASAQQGLLQIVGDFCASSNALCEACSFPEHILSWKPETEGVTN